MKVYKATDKDMKCRGFQYELGKTAEVDGDAKLCERGLHACEMPLDVLGYYVPGDGSRYFEAELEDVSDEMHSDDTKRVGKKLTLSAEIGIPGLVKAQVEYVKAQCDFDNAIKKANSEKENHATGESGAASATGWRGAASATGVRGAASATGESGAASATGVRGAASATGVRGAASATGVRGAASATDESGAASATGWRGAASATGERGAAPATGERCAASATGERGAASATGVSGAASATGERGAASATGESGAASATGERGAASATGKGCVAMATGLYGRVMGEIGNAVVCVERNTNGEIASILSAIVDGETLKPGVWYTVKNGEWVEVQ
nr:MAG TPA_asm: hypothetical protein [Caudoviricetes sp.]